MRDAGWWSRRRELAARGGDLTAAGVADGAGHPSRAHPRYELFLHGQRASVPRAAWGGIEWNEVDMHQGAQPVAQQPPEQLSTPRLIVDVSDQRVLDRHPASRGVGVVARPGSTISGGDRLRVSPPWPVAQTGHAIPQPAWLGMHTVARSG